MDELYDDLENYNEIDALEKLRCENKDLKGKLDEYATTLDKLQKDFDNLSSEHEKLEKNYSSLLKTARAEIERKTEIIKNINIEKDMLILQAYQNGNRSILNYKNSMAVENLKSANKPYVEIPDTNSSMKIIGTQIKQKPNIVTERTNGSITSAEDKPDSTNFDSGHKLKNESTKDVTSYPLNNDKNKDTKQSDNQKYVNNSDSKSIALGMTNRRKSVYMERQANPKFSSDEECDSAAAHLKEYPRPNKRDRNIPDRHYNDKYVNKLSEPSSIHDKSYGCIEFSKDKNRNVRSYDNDIYRRRDRWEYSQRYRKPDSPDRCNNRPSRNYPIDNNQRFDPVRLRPDTPPKDNHHQGRKHHSNQSNHEKHQHYEYDRFSQGTKIDTHYQGRYSSKYKRHSNFDEPYSKRMRSDFRNERYNVNRHERELLENNEIANNEQFDSQYRSCQSPDHVHTVETKPIKEIRYTSLVQLEDPRAKSKKYFLETFGDKQLCAVKGNNVELKIIKKYLWGIENVSMPNALLVRPKERHVDQSIEKLIHTDIYDPALHTSMESGEITNTTDHVENEEKIISEAQSVNSYYSNEHKSVLVSNIQIDDLSQKLLHNEQNSNVLSDQITSLKSEKIGSFKNVKKLEEHHGDSIDNYKSDIVKTNSQINVRDKDNSHIDLKGNSDSKYVCSLDLKNNINEKSYSPSRVVEGDLELSNESFDTTDCQVKANDHCNNKLNIFSKNASKSPEKDSEEKNNYENSALTNTTEQSKSSEKLQEVKVSLEENKESKSIQKKIKSKKKTKKLKEEYKYFSEEQENHNIIVKRIPIKKEREKTESVTKLQDIFGESSCNSLITPDDLGLRTTHLQTEENLFTAPFLEDAQDAIALKEKNFNTDKLETCEFVDVKYCNNPKTNEMTMSKKEDEKPCEAKYQINNESVSKPSIVHEGFRSVFKESDVMRTVVTSSCSEPSETLKKNERKDEPTIASDVSKNHDILAEALATSTPYKVLTHVNCEINETSHNSNGHQSGDSICNNETGNAPNETDGPDVRIFIRRKRKGLKKH